VQIFFFLVLIFHVCSLIFITHLSTDCWYICLITVHARQNTRRSVALGSWDRKE